MKINKYRSGMFQRTRVLSISNKNHISSTDDERAIASNLTRLQFAQRDDHQTLLSRSNEENDQISANGVRIQSSYETMDDAFLSVRSAEKTPRLRSSSDSEALIDNEEQRATVISRRKRGFFEKVKLRRQFTDSSMNDPMSNISKNLTSSCDRLEIRVDTTWLDSGKDACKHSTRFQRNPFYFGNLAFENENVYRGILRSLLHPLGVPDSMIGLRPGDLIDHLKQVFEINRDEHEFYIRQEMVHKSQAVQANVTIVEGQELKTSDKDSLNPYCILNIFHPLLRSNSHSPKSSPKSSPGSSPRLKKHSIAMLHNNNSHSEDQILRTCVSKFTSSPQWNEEFQLSVDDFMTDEIHIFICNHEENGTEKHHHDKHHSLSSLLKNVLHVSEHDKLDQHVIGKVIIPLREIPIQGSDWWWDVMPSGKGSKLLSGKCRIKLHLSYQQSSLTGGHLFSIEDYYQAAEQVYKHAAKSTEESSTLDAGFNKQDRRILDLFAQAHGISKLSQTLMHVIVLLEWSSTHSDVVTTYQALYSAIEELQMTWASKHFDMASRSQKMPISDAEIMMYRRAASSYISTMSSKLDDLVELFPPSVDNINILKQKFGVTILLLELDLWESKSSPHTSLSQKILHKLQEDTDKWVTDKIGQIFRHDPVPDPVIPRMNSLVELTNLLSSHCHPIGVINMFYNSLGIGYFRIVSFCVEKQISPLIREYCQEMDKYQRRYHQFSVNITYSSRLSLRMFFASKKLYSIIRDNISRRDVFRLIIHQYQDWFLECLVFWLQTFRTECVTRIERALEIDKDVVVTHSLVKFSNSSVDVKACFAQITEEWRQIDYHDPDSSVMGIIKITDLICDGARMYTDKIQLMMERNNYYDDTEEQFDITERLCITLNNIEHVRQYLTELPMLMDWESVCMLLSTKHENDDIGNKANSTLNRLVNSADKEILLKCSMLIIQIVEKMKVDIARFMGLFTKKTPEKASSIDPLILYLSTNLRTLQERLFNSIYPRIIEELWRITISLFQEQLLVGERPEYYSQMRQYLRALTSYFVRDGLGESRIQTEFYENLKTCVELNALTTEELMLDYFYTLADDMECPIDFLGNLAVKTCYMEETRGNVTIYVKVIRASDLPGLDSSGLSDPYVIVSLYPKTMFGHNKPQRTKIMDQTLNPVFNSTFQFPNVPKEYMSVKGAVILMSILDHDKIGSDDFAGEVAVHLSSVPVIQMSGTVDSKPAVMLPIKRPCSLQYGPYKVLEDRCSWDKTAKLFINDRKRFIEKQRKRTDTSSSRFFSFFRGKKS